MRRDAKARPARKGLKARGSPRGPQAPAGTDAAWPKDRRHPVAGSGRGGRTHRKRAQEAARRGLPAALAFQPHRPREIPEKGRWETSPGNGTSRRIALRAPGCLEKEEK